MTQEGDPRHDDLPQDQERPGVQLCRHIEEAKDASLLCASEAVVHHYETKDDA